MKIVLAVAVAAAAVLSSLVVDPRIIMPGRCYMIVTVLATALLPGLILLSMMVIIIILDMIFLNRWDSRLFVQAS